MTLYEQNLYELDEEIRQFAKDSNDDDTICDAYNLSDHLIGGVISVRRAEEELNKLRDREENLV